MQCDTVLTIAIFVGALTTVVLLAMIAADIAAERRYHANGMGRHQDRKKGKRDE